MKHPSSIPFHEVPEQAVYLDLCQRRSCVQVSRLLKFIVPGKTREYQFDLNI